MINSIIADNCKIASVDFTYERGCWLIHESVQICHEQHIMHGVSYWAQSAKSDYSSALHSSDRQTKLS